MRRIEYMEWVKLKRSTKYEIGGSGVVPVSIDELPEARQAIDVNDFNLYGYRPLVQAIANRYEVDTNQVVTTQGCSMANYLACAAVLKAGDEVLVEKPAYEPLLGVVRLLGAKVNRFVRRFDKGYRVDLDEVEKRLTKKTRLIVLSNMHNPTGVLTSNETLKEIGALARKVKAYVLVDEVYLDFLFEQRPKSCVHLGPNFLSTSSLTKAYGLDGLRCGWILANSDIATAIWRLQDFFGVNGTIPAEKTSTVALMHLPRFVERTRSIIQRNRVLVDRFLSAHSDKLECIAPDGGPVCFPRVKDDRDVSEFVKELAEERQTRVIPGAFFEAPRHFRLGFGGDTAVLRGGLKNLAAAL